MSKLDAGYEILSSEEMFGGGYDTFSTEELDAQGTKGGIRFDGDILSTEQIEAEQDENTRIMLESSERDNFDYLKYGGLVSPDMVASWRDQDKIDYREQAFRTPLISSIPFLGVAAELKDFHKTKTSLDRLVVDDYQGQTGKKAIDLVRVQKHLLKEAEEEARGKTIGAGIYSTVAQMPAFAGELYTTGGLATAGSRGLRTSGKWLLRKGVRQGLKTAFLKGVALRGAGWLVAGGIQAGVSLPHRMVKEFDKKEIETVLGGQFSVTPTGIEIDSMGEESPLTNAFKSVGDVYIEALTERSGGALGKGVKTVLKPIIPKKFMGAFARYASKFVSSEKMSKIWTRAGFHGVLEEMGEERLADFMRAVFKLEGDPDQGLVKRAIESQPDVFKKEDRDRLLTEFASFLFPGVGRMATSAYHEETIKKRRVAQLENLQKLEEEMAKIQAEEDSAEAEAYEEWQKSHATEEEQEERTAYYDIPLHPAEEGKQELQRVEGEKALKDVQGEVSTWSTKDLEEFIDSRYEEGAPQEELNVLEEIYAERASEENEGLVDQKTGEDAESTQEDVGLALDEILAKTYKSHALDKDQTYGSDENFAGNVRSNLTHPQLKTGFTQEMVDSLSDEQVIKIAKDAYDRRQKLVAKQKAKKVEPRKVKPLKKEDKRKLNKGQPKKTEAKLVRQKRWQSIIRRGNVAPPGEKFLANYEKEEISKGTKRMKKGGIEFEIFFKELKGIYGGELPAENPDEFFRLLVEQQPWSNADVAQTDADYEKQWKEAQEIFDKEELNKIEQEETQKVKEEGWEDEDDIIAEIADTEVSEEEGIDEEDEGAKEEVKPQEKKSLELRGEYVDAIVAPSAKEPGRWQATYIQKDGTPSGDSVRDTFEEAVEEARRTTGVLSEEQEADAKLLEPQQGKGEKQPWEMTKEEYAEQKLKDLGFKKTETSKSMRKRKSLKKADLEYNHFKDIEQALKEGKPIPAEVLKDYPELKAKPTLEEGKGVKEKTAEYAIEQTQKYPEKTKNILEKGYVPITREEADMLEDKGGSMLVSHLDIRGDKTTGEEGYFMKPPSDKLITEYKTGKKIPMYSKEIHGIYKQFKDRFDKAVTNKKLDIKQLGKDLGDALPGVGLSIEDVSRSKQREEARKRILEQHLPILMAEAKRLGMTLKAYLEKFTDFTKNQIRYLTNLPKPREKKIKYKEIIEKETGVTVRPLNEKREKERLKRLKTREEKASKEGERFGKKIEKAKQEAKQEENITRLRRKHKLEALRRAIVKRYKDKEVRELLAKKVAKERGKLQNYKEYIRERGARARERRHISNHIKKMIRFIKKMPTTSLPLEYKDAIEEIKKSVDFDRVRLSNVLSQTKAKKLDISDELKGRVDTLQKINSATMTLSELEEVHQVIQQIYHSGIWADKLMKSKKHKTLLEAVKAGAKTILGDIKPPDAAFKKYISDEFSKMKPSKRRQLIAEHRLPEWLMEQFDGYTEGTSTNVVWKPLLRAEQELFRKAEIANARLTRIFKPLRLSKILRKKIYVPEMGIRLTKDNMMFIYANSLHAHNREHLYGSGITDDMIAAVEKNLSESEKRAVHKTMELLTDMWSRIDAVYGRITGTHLGRIIENYFPIMNLENVGSLEAVEMNINMLLEFERVGDPGLLKTRVPESKKAFKKYSFLNNTSNYVRNAEYYMAFAEALRDASKYLKHPTIKEAIDVAYGKEYNQMLDSWLQDIKRGKLKADDSWFGKLAGELRRNLAFSVLGMNASVVVKQPASFVQGLRYIGNDGLFWGTVGAIKTMGSALGGRAYHDMIAKSVQMKNRGFNQERVLRDILDGRSTIRKFDQIDMRDFINVLREVGMQPIMMADRVTTTIIWNAAYSKKMHQNKGKNEQGAIDYADKVIRLTQPQSGILHSPAMFRKGSFVSLFTIFRNQTNKNQNLIHSAVTKYGASKEKIKDLPGFMLDSLGYVIIPAILIGMLSRKRWQEDEKEVMYDLLSGLTGGIIFIGDVFRILQYPHGSSGVIDSLYDDIKYALLADDFGKFSKYMGRFIAKRYGIPSYTAIERMIMRETFFEKVWGGEKK